jgi:ankyrin repeat protein
MTSQSKACLIKPPRPAALAMLRKYPDLRKAHYHSETALHFLVSEGFVDAAVFCAENGFGVNEENDYGDTPLTLACRLGNADLVIALLAHGADPDLPSSGYGCPLDCCLQTGRTDLMGILLDNGANPYYRTDEDKTIFDFCTNDYEKRKRVDALLAERGIDITKAFPEG